jgi:hypothetical protein
VVAAIIGNHESDDGDHYKHYEAIAWGEPYGVDANSAYPAAPPTVDASTIGGAPSTSTASTALAAYMTKHTLYAMGAHGTTPSNTSRYVSTNIGLFHLVGLDLNSLDPAQLAWLEKDLAATDRELTPW